jgi:basic membrane protein A
VIGRCVRWAVPVTVALLALAACSDDDDGGSGASGAGACPGTAGCIPPGQPDVDHDGKVRIGILSPGDTNDNGYYESFVVTARDFATRNTWELVIVGMINRADAQEQARAICRQHVDMVAIAASELADAIPVAAEPVCRGTVWYVAGGAGVVQTPYFFQTNDDLFEGQYATGAATGLVMRRLGIAKAAFITGAEAEFAKNAFRAWTAGIESVLPGAQTVASYTGSFDDSAVAVEAAQAQLSQGAQIIYPYLGGSTDAVVDLASKAGVLSITPGTDRCADRRFGISSIFSPGVYFAAALEDFEAGHVTLGVTRTFHIGKDPVPTVKICGSVTDAASLQSQVDDTIAQIATGTIDPHAETAKLGG